VNTRNIARCSIRSAFYVSGRKAQVGARNAVDTGHGNDEHDVGWIANERISRREIAMEIHELVIEMKLLERRLTLYEEKYGVLSEDFYAALTSGKLARYDEYDETRADFSRWKGIYETWLRRKQAYTEQLKQRELLDALRFQPAY
jgi:hypothetical protein